MEYVRRSTSIFLVLVLCKTTTIKYPRDEMFLLLCEDLRINDVKIYRFIDWSSHKRLKHNQGGKVGSTLVKKSTLQYLCFSWMACKYNISSLIL